MSGCADDRRRLRGVALLTTPVFLFLAACQPDAETAPPEVRPVRTVTVVKRESGETVAFTGRIEAENETRLAFRIGGGMIRDPAQVGAPRRPRPGAARDVA